MSEKSYPSQSQDRFIVRLPDGMRERIAEEAKKNNRSMNAEIVSRLEQTFNLVSAAPLSKGIKNLSNNIKMLAMEAIVISNYASSLEKYLDVVDPGGPRPPRPSLDEAALESGSKGEGG